MSAVQEAAANTVFRIANLFEQNCALKHGLPKVGGPDRIDATPPEQPATVPPINITNNIPAAPATNSPSPPGATAAATVESRSLLSRAAPWLLAAGTAGVGGVGGYMLSKPTATVVEQAQQPNDGSLLQALQDRGLHLPEGTWPTK